MTKMAKCELVKKIKSRYLQARKMAKTKILDELCQNTGYNRKYATRILQAGYEHDKVKRLGRKSRSQRYGPNVIEAAIKIWELLEYPCGVRLKPSLVPMIKVLERHKELNVSDEVKEKLETISSTTLDRKLKKERKLRRLKRNRGTTRHGSLLKSSVPIRITNWDTSKVGFMEIDTVAHNGGDPNGECLYTLDMVEIYSGWSEQMAVTGKGQAGVVRAIDEVKKCIPFNLEGLDSDTGSEFVNWHMVDYCEKNKLFFTRSRPDRKNDNAYVEQKNYTHVRHWLGYGRYDSKEQKELINDLYRNELGIFNNFFRPVMKIESKEKVNNSICKKKYDTAQTPYQRLMASKSISMRKKQELTKIYRSLNPMLLRKEIDLKITAIRKTAK